MCYQPTLIPSHSAPYTSSQSVTDLIIRFISLRFVDFLSTQPQAKPLNIFHSKTYAALNMHFLQQLVSLTCFFLSLSHRLHQSKNIKINQHAMRLHIRIKMLICSTLERLKSARPNTSGCLSITQDLQIICDCLWNFKFVLCDCLQISSMHHTKNTTILVSVKSISTLSKTFDN